MGKFVWIPSGEHSIITVNRMVSKVVGGREEFTSFSWPIPHKESCLCWKSRGGVTTLFVISFKVQCSWRETKGWKTKGRTKGGLGILKTFWEVLLAAQNIDTHHKQLKGATLNRQKFAVPWLWGLCFFLTFWWEVWRFNVSKWEVARQHYHQDTYFFLPSLTGCVRKDLVLQE